MFYHFLRAFEASHEELSRTLVPQKAALSRSSRMVWSMGRVGTSCGQAPSSAIQVIFENCDYKDGDGMVMMKTWGGDQLWTGTFICNPGDFFVCFDDNVGWT